MNQNKKLFIAKFAVVLAVPVVLWAFSAGPDAHKSGVPGTGEGTCNEVGCHVGAAVNGGGGSVTITAAEGTGYTPAKKQTLTIKITDSAARAYGFQITARLASDHSKQAGTFTVGTSQLVLCAGTAVSDLGGTRPNSGTCPASKPLEFIEHSRALSTSTITVDWTPPSSDVGPIDFYLSANAANGNGNESGDHIYTASLQLKTATVGGVQPIISAGGVINAFGFGGKAGVAPGTWIEIYGQNLSGTTRSWAGGDFNGSNAPTTIDTVTVTVAGKPAYIDFVSPGQVNAQVPDGIGTGPVPVVVTLNGVASSPLTLTASDMLPGILAPAGFKVGSTQYVVAQLADNSFVGDPTKIPGTNRPAKPGETIVLYGIGFGAVTPSVAAGTIVGAANSVSNNLVIRFGQIQATSVTYKGLTPGFVGLYQFNVVVPSTVPDGDSTLDVAIGSVSTGQTLSIPIKK